ncbi:hypothetical protein PTTG_29016, partial [Puccinia triticina 1-1 BBBD Race 1]
LRAPTTRPSTRACSAGPRADLPGASLRRRVQATHLAQPVHAQTRPARRAPGRPPPSGHPLRHPRHRLRLPPCPEPPDPGRPTGHLAPYLFPPPQPRPARHLCHPGARAGLPPLCLRPLPARDRHLRPLTSPPPPSLCANENHPFVSAP